MNGDFVEDRDRNNKCRKVIVKLSACTIIFYTMKFAKRNLSECVILNFM